MANRLLFRKVLVSTLLDLVEPLFITPHRCVGAGVCKSHRGARDIKAADKVQQPLTVQLTDFQQPLRCCLVSTSPPLLSRAVLHTSFAAWPRD